MKDIILIMISISIAALFAGCTKDYPLVPDSDLVVVQAYLYANEPVRDIRLTSTLPLDADTTKAPPINDASITLIKDGQRYNLIPSPGDSGYYHYPGEDLRVAENDRFELEIDYRDRLISAQTVVPQAPAGLSLSGTKVTVPDFSGGFGFPDRSLMDSLAVEVFWENRDQSLFFIVLDNVDENPVEIDPGFGGGFRLPIRFISQPLNRESFRLNFRMFTHLGRHRLKLYRINQEYVDLYESRQQDSRDLNEPLTNIKNGLGVFSAFNSDSVFFEVVQ